MKKILSGLLAVSLMLSFVCVSVSAETYSQGDADMDGSVYVQASDIAMLKRILLGEKATETADVNEDGKVDIRDLVHIKKLSAATIGIELKKGKNTFDFS